MFDLAIAMLLAASAASTNASAAEASAAPATEAASTEQPQAPREDSKEKAKPKKICRKLPGGTGSRLDSGKVCKTAEQWKQYYSE